MKSKMRHFIRQEIKRAPALTRLLYVVLFAYGTLIGYVMQMSPIHNGKVILCVSVLAVILVLACAKAGRLLQLYIEQDTLSDTTHPASLEYILYLIVPRKERIDVLGGFQEEYTEIREKFGRKCANFWYAKQVLCLLIHNLLRGARHLLAAWRIITIFRNFWG